MIPALREEQLLYVTTTEAWRDWLQNNYRTAEEIWLVFYKKHAQVPSLLYNDAVEEALCFGWIDSIMRPLDSQRHAQRFSPRRPKSSYSQANIERLRHLVSQGKVMPEVLETVKHVLDQPFEIAADILAAIRANPQAWDNFQAFSPPYVRIRIAFIEGARKRPEEFQKRLKYFIAMSAKNKLFGFGGIDKYF